MPKNDRRQLEATGPDRDVASVASKLATTEPAVDLPDHPTPRAVAVHCLKGGIGKSTIAVNLADALARRGNEVALVDLDPNGHATVGLGYDDVYRRGAEIIEPRGDHFDAGERVDLGDLVLDSAPRDATDRYDVLGALFHETDYGFDLVPATSNLEQIESRIADATYPATTLRRRLLYPNGAEDGTSEMLGTLSRDTSQADTEQPEDVALGMFDYVVVDSPGYRGKLSDNALVASENLLLPMTPGPESINGLEKTTTRQLTTIRESMDLRCLAIVPNMLKDRLDHDTATRRLIETLNRDYQRYLPQFARLDPSVFQAIDAGEWDGALPKPGLRYRAGAVGEAYNQRVPVSGLEDQSDMLAHFDQLASVVTYGGASRVPERDVIAQEGGR